jgi:hypothetical protein
MTTTCVTEPISWLRLEQHALAADPAVAAHLASCAACRECFAQLEGDRVVLPALPAIAPRRRTRWWLLAVPALAAAAIGLVVLRPAPRPEIATVKGVGEIRLEVVRERDGAVSFDARRFLPGDRWKVIVTCPPDASAWIDVAVIETGAQVADYPLAPARVACGNRVVIPGAFTITGHATNQVCARIAADRAPPRQLPRPGDEGVACVALAPE